MASPSIFADRAPRPTLPSVHSTVSVPYGVRAANMACNPCAASASRNRNPQMVCIGSALYGAVRAAVNRRRESAAGSGIGLNGLVPDCRCLFAPSPQPSPTRGEGAGGRRVVSVEIFPSWFLPSRFHLSPFFPLPPPWGRVGERGRKEMGLTYLTIVRRLFATRQAEGRKILRPYTSALKGKNRQKSSSTSCSKKGRGESGAKESKREGFQRKRRASFLPPLPLWERVGERGKNEGEANRLSPYMRTRSCRGSYSGRREARAGMRRPATSIP